MSRRRQNVSLVILQLLVLTPGIQGFSSSPPPPVSTLIRIRQSKPRLSRNPLLILSSKADDYDVDDQDSSDRLGGVRQAVSEIASTGFKDTVQAGDVIIAKVDLPKQQIYANEGYQIVSIYDQVVDKETGQVEKKLVDQLEDMSTTKSESYTRYLQLQVNSEETAIVTPAEIGLVTLKDELTLSLWLAIPGFFWVVVAWNFAHYYNERYGGNFLDAMFRT
mmetsp:Transcript_2950/g.6960  ORF Transcript_2950/g.6960 Transcript_2950/m.6960 type:complete len:220 (+) Transcript_2950:51-710(+)